MEEEVLLRSGVRRGRGGKEDKDGKDVYIYMYIYTHIYTHTHTYADPLCYTTETNTTL